MRRIANLLARRSAAAPARSAALRRAALPLGLTLAVGAAGAVALSAGAWVPGAPIAQLSTAAAAPKTASDVLKSLTLNEKDFVQLLSALMKHCKSLQNNPPDLIPQEELPAQEVVAFLEPYTYPKGPLRVRKVAYQPGRTNLVIEYPAEAGDKVVSFVGSHFDVVTADPKEWSFDPFSLGVDGDKLTGRGVTDCLGHVALISCLFKSLAIEKPKLKQSVKAIFIASEENSTIENIGVDEMMKHGELDTYKNGPLFWVDSANFGPTLGSASVAAWEMTFHGKLFHSGMPHKGINTIELASAVMQYVQKRFHEDYALTDKERRYKYAIGSSLKPTQISTPPGGLNQIPGKTTVRGDVRITPFFSVPDVQRKIEKYLEELDLSKLPTFGYGKYELPEEGLKGSVSLKWLGDAYEGIAVDLDSPGYKALYEATKDVRGTVNEFSLTGSLPLVGDLQKAGYDIQMCGFGRMDAYHAVNEYGMLSEFKQGYQILARVIDILESRIK